MKKSKTNKIIILLIYILIVTGVVISSTYSRYTSSNTSSGIAAIAAWKIKFTDTDNNEITESTTFKLTDTTILNGKIEEEKIAPGTSGALAVKIDARGTEVALTYMLELKYKTAELPTNIQFYQDAQYNEPVELSTEGEYTIASSKGYMTTAETSQIREHAIYWKWNYETAGGDSVDTQEGEEALSTNFTLKMTAVQLDDRCIHQWDEGEQIAAATCTEDGEIRYTCSKCSEIKVVKIPATGHQASSEYSYSNAGHYYDCKFCGIRITEVEAHNLVGGVCSECGYTGKFNVTYNLFKMTSSNNASTVNAGSSYSTNLAPINSLAYQRPDTISINMGGVTLTSGYTYNNVSGDLTISNITGNLVINAAAKNYSDNTSFTNSKETTVGESNTANLTQKWQIRVFEFIPETTGTYRFYSNDSVASTRATDPYAYLFSGNNYNLEQLDTIALNYSQTGNTSYLSDKCLTYNDDGGDGYNFSFTYNCNAGETYYLVVRTYTPDKTQTFDNIYIVNG